MRNIIVIIAAAIVIVSCKTEPKEMGWVFDKEVKLDGINPIGIAFDDNGFWLSDGDHNRVVKIDESGTIISILDSLERPMHIATNQGELVIPQYGNDEVLRFRDSEKIIVSLLDSLDAPAGADINGNEIAIADFYNNKVHYANQNDEWIIFGKKGKAPGEFTYPTDVQLTNDAIWVADAYNNRIQKFDKHGNHQLTIGEDQQMNAATGLFVSDKQVVSTDFENSRVLVFDLEGGLLQELKETINKPTDALIVNNTLYVTNYKGSSLSVYTWGKLLEIAADKE